MNANASPRPESSRPAHDPGLPVKLGLTPNIDETADTAKRPKEDWMDNMEKKYTLSILMASLRRF